MSVRFQRRIRLLPGVTLNIGKTGVSVTIGVRGARWTIGRRGHTASVGLPGTGLSYGKQVSHDSAVKMAKGTADEPSAQARPAPPQSAWDDFK